jgi:hypothetical protein
MFLLAMALMHSSIALCQLADPSPSLAIRSEGRTDSELHHEQERGREDLYHHVLQEVVCPFNAGTTAWRSCLLPRIPVA